MIKFLNLIIGGVSGTLARYLFSGFIYRIFGTTFPYGTLAVNLSGCLIVGFLASLSEKKFLLDPNARILLMVGFCGAFTTFSTFILETSNLLRDGETVRAFWNVMGCVAIGFVLFRIGFWIGEII